MLWTGAWKNAILQFDKQREVSLFYEGVRVGDYRPGLHRGLILNFNKELLKAGIKRVVL